MCGSCSPRAQAPAAEPRRGLGGHPQPAQGRGRRAAGAVCGADDEPGPRRPLRRRQHHQAAGAAAGRAGGGERGHPLQHHSRCVGARVDGGASPGRAAPALRLHRSFSGDQPAASRRRRCAERPEGAPTGQQRHTLCVSSEVGCQMGCTFCATGTMGLTADLTAGEILEQLVHASRITPIRNVVFMVRREGRRAQPGARAREQPRPCPAASTVGPRSPSALPHSAPPSRPRRAWASR